MEENYIEESVRVRLILSGISELEEHGITDFSLRRAALGAQVSCAAPYRHFKDKDEYIREIIKYVNSKWELLTREIEKIFESDTRRLAIEICIASLRFRMANRNFRSVFTLAARDGDKNVLDFKVISAVKLYCGERGLSEHETDVKIFVARALVSGALNLVGENNSEELLSLAKEKLEEEFK